jgi:hypothetical protein
MPSGHAALGSGRAWERRSAILHGFVSTAAAERALRAKVRHGRGKSQERRSSPVQGRSADCIHGSGSNTPTRFLGSGVFDNRRDHCRLACRRPAMGRPQPHSRACRYLAFFIVPLVLPCRLTKVPLESAKGCAPADVAASSAAALRSGK